MTELLYRQHIIDHYRYPRNFGRLKKPTHAFGHANISCGDQVQFQARIIGNRIIDVAFTGEGCAISMAANSLTSEFVKGKTLTFIQKLTLREIQRLLGISVSPARERCAMLAADTLKQMEKIRKK